MSPQSSKHTTQRGRTPATTKSSSPTASTASTRAKAKPSLSSSAGKAVSRLKSQPLKAPLKQESLTVPPKPSKNVISSEKREQETVNVAEAGEEIPDEETLGVKPPSVLEAIDSQCVVTSEKHEPEPVNPIHGAALESTPGEISFDTNVLETPEPENSLPHEASATTEPLQVAAQTFPWLHMTSTLDACFAETDHGAKVKLPESEKQGEKPQPSDDQLRDDAEHLIEFCDISSDSFTKTAPIIMQSFISFEETSERIELEALHIAKSSPSLDSEEPLQLYNDMMDRLDELQEQAAHIEAALLSITESDSRWQHVQNPDTNEEGDNERMEGEDEHKPNHDEGGHERQLNHDDGENEKPNRDDVEVSDARAQMINVFVTCLEVLRARMANLTMAQELIDSAQENFSLALRMEDMGI